MRIAPHLDQTDIRKLIEHIEPWRAITERELSADIKKKVTKDHIVIDQLCNRLRKAAGLLIDVLEPLTISHDAAFIRAVCRQRYRVGARAPQHGFQNRGAWPSRRRADSQGFDFAGYRELREGEPVTGKLDWNVMGRTEKIVERRYVQQQSRTTMLVVDPRCYDYSYSEHMRMLAGTIAQMALQRGDPVGVVIGKGGAYLKPKHAPTQLMHVLKACAAPATSQGTLAELLEQPILRRNMPHGAEIVLVSPIDAADDARKLEKIASALRARGVTLTVVKTSNKIKKPRPVVQIGGMEYPISEDAVRAALRETSRHETEVIKETLSHLGGRFIDISAQGERDTIAETTVNSFMHEADESLVDLITPDLAEPNTQVFFEGEELLSMDRGTEGYEKVYAGGATPDIEMAKLTGFGPLFNRIRSQIDYSFLFSDVLTAEEQKELEALRRDFRSYEPPSFQFAQKFLGMPQGQGPIEKWADAPLPPHIALAWGPGPKFYERFAWFENKIQKKLERLKRMHKGKLADTEHSRAVNLAPTERFSPETSGVDKPENDGNESVWQRIMPRPRGRHAYLRNFIGVDFDGATAAYRGRDALALARFAEDGAKRARGVITTHVPDVQSLPVPVGGRIEKTEKRLWAKGYKVDYRVSDEEPEDVARFKSMRLSAFHAATAAMYGAELYTAMTRAVSLDDIPESARDEWRSLLDRLHKKDVTVGAAIALIQAHVVKHPRIKYHTYAGDPIKEEIFKEFSERAAKGEARGADEHLSLALMLGGGACVEMAKITMTLMRMAGIPTVFSTGYLAKKGEVTSEGHAWAEAVFPHGEGQWYGEPVETSVIHLADAAIQTLKKLLKKFQKKSKDETNADFVEHDDASQETTEDTADQNNANTAANEADIEEAHSAAIVASLKKTAAANPDMPREVAQVLDRAASALQRADEATRKNITHWLSALPALMDLKDKEFMGANAAELVLRNWRAHLGSHYGGPTDIETVTRAALQASENPLSRTILIRWAEALNSIIDV